MSRCNINHGAVQSQVCKLTQLLAGTARADTKRSSNRSTQHSPRWQQVALEQSTGQCLVAIPEASHMTWIPRSEADTTPTPVQQPIVAHVPALVPSMLLPVVAVVFRKTARHITSRAVTTCPVILLLLAVSGRRDSGICVRMAYAESLCGPRTWRCRRRRGLPSSLRHASREAPEAILQ